MLKEMINKLQTAENIKLPILALFFIIILCTFFITAKSTSDFANSVLQNNISEKFAEVHRFYDDEINAQKDIQELINFSMAGNELVINLLSKKNRDFSVLKPIYDYLNEHNNITHLYLLTPDKKVMYRAHQPNRRGDIIERETLNKASSTLSTYSGLEFGVLGTFTLRSVTPVYLDWELVGFIEVGMETGHIVERAEKQFHVELFELFDHVLIPDDTSEKLLKVTGRKSDQHSLSDYVINFNKNGILDERKLFLIKNLIEVNQIIQKGNIALDIREVKDIAGKIVGKQIFLSNIESLIKERDTQLKNITRVYIITLVIGLVIFSFILSFIEQRIRRYIAEQKKSNDIIKQNIADLKEAQSSLIEKEKLASLGKVVAGVSHEINTPIGIAVTMGSTIKRNVFNFIDLLKEGKLRRSDLELFETDFNNGIEVLLPSLDKASDLIHSFKQVAVDQTSEARRRFKLSEVVEEIIMTLNHQIKRTSIRCEYQIDDQIHMDSFPGPLGQILTNLYNNAIIHAFEERQVGLIKIEAEASDSQVIIRIIDNGKGIPTEDIDKIFDPFYTTKLGKGGSGLGLNIIYNIVVGLMGGTINVTSNLGDGACFIINLPLMAPTEE
jgi:signal transduction histidine kinase